MKTYLDPSEVERMENAATCVRDRLLIRMLFRLGCRISEALALEVKDIDFIQGRVTIQHLKNRIRLSCPHCDARLGKTHLFCPRCGVKVEKAVAAAKEHIRVRTLPIDGGTLDILQDYIDRGGAIPKNGKVSIFGITRTHGWKIVKECAKRAGLGKLINAETDREHNISPHRLRDAFAIKAIKVDDSGDGLRLLQEHLGHQNITTTMRYRKLSGQELREWYNKLWD